MAKKNKTSLGLVRTLGPVSDLERHLPNDWWRSLFNSVYLKTDGDVVENGDNTRQDVDILVRACALEPNDHILDLCCGQGRHSIELAKRGFQHVTGIDRSRSLIRLAKKRANEAAVEVEFHEGDARKFRLPESKFHCVAILGNSFGYFTREEDDLAVLESVYRVLQPGGVLALDIANGDWVREHFEKRSWEWIDEDQFVCRERSLSADKTRLISREVVVHAERGVIVDQFYAERLYSRPQLEALLKRVGFDHIREHGSVPTYSARNQDLGMMANRFFITAQKPRLAIASREKSFKVRHVTVLLGDPSLPDDVKLEGKFNPEDFDTIHRLKKALSEIPGYMFSYLDNHTTLLSALRYDPPQFVLNLCDEGFQNDAFKELHVPAYLEMLDIPYTGAGPACLGICYNKSLVRALAASLDIPVPLETYFNPDDQAATLPSTFPALVKPNWGDSSVGITKNAVVNTPEELMAHVRYLQDTLPGRSVLIQEFLSGPEYSVGIVGNPGLSIEILPILEVDYSALPPELPQILGYESKWIPSSPYWKDIRYRKACLDEETTRRLHDYSNELFERLGCRDYARFDFRTDANGEIKLLEVNPNPGWCWDGKFNIMAGFAGWRYADLLQRIISAAEERFALEKSSPKTAAVAS